MYVFVQGTELGFWSEKKRKKVEGAKERMY